jgi:thiamine kinase-like enzyme
MIRLEISAPDPFQHAAARAWNQLCSLTTEPSYIEILKEERKSSVYRVVGVGPGGVSIIAKRCLPRYADAEQTIYKKILPHLPISKLVFYGSVIEPDTDYVWLFIEDGGNGEFAFSIQEHRRLAARWLGQLHAIAAGIPAVFCLSDRGPNYYLSHLRRAREVIERNLENSVFKAHDVHILKGIILQCESIETRWGHIERLCSQYPQTLVHGDFAKQNLRMRLGASGINLVVFDWEKAGVGVPAPDIAELLGRGVLGHPENGMLSDSGLTEYLSIVSRSWSDLDPAAIKQLAVLGAVFRLLAAISWESEELEYGRCAIEGLHSFQLKLAVALKELGFA